MSTPKLCPLCHAANQCELLEAANAGKTCWCMQIKIAPEVLAKVPSEKVNLACICHACAIKLPTKQN